MEEIGLGSGVGSDGGFDLTSAPRCSPSRSVFRSSRRLSRCCGCAAPLAARHATASAEPNWAANFAAAGGEAPARLPHPDEIADLKPLGQVSASFIVAVNGEGLWIVDQHVAHERVLFEQHLEARRAGKVESQRMLMPMILELAPRQLVIYEKIAEELSANGFEVEPMGPRSVAIQAVPAGVANGDAEKLLTEILDGIERENAAISIETLQAKIAASHRVSRSDQGQHAARSNKNGMAARRAGENGLPDELPARTPGGAALFGERNRARVPPNLEKWLKQFARGEMSETQKTAVIFGLANKRSIAWAIAQKLHAGGWRLAITYQNERLELEAKDLIADLPGAAGFMCDVTQDDQIAKLFEELKEKYGVLHGLVHSIGVCAGRAI